jgi:hypothetical protein
VTARSFMLVAALAAFAAPVLGCSSGMVHLSHDEYERLPRDSRQEIFDSENDLVIARNRQDDAVEHREKAERAIDELEERWQRASKRLTATGQAGRISQARKVFDTQKVYLDSEVEVAKASITTTEAGTDVARARLQLVRGRQLARIGRVTVGSLKPLEEKVASIDAQVKSATNAENALRARAQGQLDAWKAAQDSYARSTGDYDTAVLGD